MRIPFDSLGLAAVVAECQGIVGCKLDQVSQLDDFTIVLSFYDGAPNWLLVSSHPTYFRAHLLTRRPSGLKPAPAFCAEMRKNLEDASVSYIRQRGLDRVLEIGFKATSGTFLLIAELMGKHANLILVDSKNKCVAAAKWVGASKSRRPILPHQPYLPPPFPAKPNLLSAGTGDELQEFEGASPFLVKLIDSGTDLTKVQDSIQNRQFPPVYVPGAGAYPFSVRTLVVGEVARESYSQALEQHYAAIIESDKLAQVQISLRIQLQRVKLAREVAIASLDEAIENARTARNIQMKGELILAYQQQIHFGGRELECFDYEGNPLKISLLPDLTPAENAERYFAKAKRAKARIGEVQSQRDRLALDLMELDAVLNQIENGQSSQDMSQLVAIAEKHNWLRKTGEALAKEERPYEGHSIRELLSPGGWKVLYGTNATSNDYLTSKVARPSDLWFHVRGAPSAHVVLCTNNQPLRVQKADLEFAAKVSVRNSAVKHSGYVSVDYVQKRYVRKPRGSAPGAASYSNEKTIHVTDDGL